jgi:hypothetical protein
MGEIRSPYKILVGKREGKRPLWRPRRRLEYNIRMGPREIEWEGVNSSGSVADYCQHGSET